MIKKEIALGRMESMKKFNDILFAGGGIGGLTSAILARKVGIDCRVLEQAPKFEKKGSGLSIMSNAILALREFGMDQAFRDIGEPIVDFQVRDTKDRLIFSSDFKRISKEVGAPSICVHRGDLQKLLLEMAHDIPVEFNSKVLDFSKMPEGIMTEAQVDGESRFFHSKLLIGSDGLRSKIRELLEQKNPDLALLKTPLRTSGFTAWLSTIPFKDEFFKQGSVIHYWGEGVRVGLVDIGKGRLYWWITMNHSLIGPALKENGQKIEILREYFKNWPALVRCALEQTPLAQEIIQVETLDRKPRQIWGSGPITLLGDAAHPSLTSLGQGAGMAIEDAVVLVSVLEKDLSTNSLRSYERLRVQRTTKVSALSRNVATYEQFQNKLAVTLRNAVFRVMPQTMIDSQNKSLLSFSSPRKKK